MTENLATNITGSLPTEWWPTAIPTLVPKLVKLKWELLFKHPVLSESCLFVLQVGTSFLVLLLYYSFLIVNYQIIGCWPHSSHKNWCLNNNYSTLHVTNIIHTREIFFCWHVCVRHWGAHIMWIFVHRNSNFEWARARSIPMKLGDLETKNVLYWFKPFTEYIVIWGGILSCHDLATFDGTKRLEMA